VQIALKNTLFAENEVTPGQILLTVHF